MKTAHKVGHSLNVIGVNLSLKEPLPYNLRVHFFFFKFKAGSVISKGNLQVSLILFVKSAFFSKCISNETLSGIFLCLRPKPFASDKCAYRRQSTHCEHQGEEFTGDQKAH